jgi:flagellar basal body-associated protein FliL
MVDAQDGGIGLLAVIIAIIIVILVIIVIVLAISWAWHVFAYKVNGTEDKVLAICESSINITECNQIYGGPVG